MPSYVLNRLQVFGDTPQDCQRVFDFLYNKETSVTLDFERLLPIPEELRDISVRREDVISDDDYIRYLVCHSDDGSRETLPKRADGTSSHPIGQTLAIELHKKWGASNPRAWIEKSWGCRGAYDVLFSTPDVARFNTSGVMNPWLMRTLSDRFPDVTLLHDWAGEDLGKEVGRMIWTNGELSVPSRTRNGHFTDDTVSAWLHSLWLDGGEEEWFVKIDDSGKATYLYGYQGEDTQGALSLAKTVGVYRRHLAELPLSDIPAFFLPTPKK